jgi:hypothetical protein
VKPDFEPVGGLVAKYCTAQGLTRPYYVTVFNGWHICISKRKEVDKEMTETVGNKENEGRDETYKKGISSENVTV